MGLNRVILIGYVGEAPEMRYTAVERLARVRLATHEYRNKPNGEAVQRVEWHSVVFYGEVALTVERLVKRGTHLYVEGRLQTSLHESATGETRRVTEVVARTFEILDGEEVESDPLH